MICGAKLRCKDRFCKKYALIGRSRCSLHGALSLSGLQHPNFKHGRRSKAYIENARIARAELRLLEYLGRAYGLFVE